MFDLVKYMKIIQYSKKIYIFNIIKIRLKWFFWVDIRLCDNNYVLHQHILILIFFYISIVS